MTEGSRRAILAAFFANLGIAAAKLAAFATTGAASMLAESVHSLADTGNQGLLLLGSSRSRRAATEEHPFGYGRERYFWAFVVALVLFSMGCLFAIYEGIDKLRHPHSLESVGWAVLVLGVAIALESWSLRTAVVEVNRVRGDQSIWSFVRRSKSPELPVVLLEDLGALVGLVFALAGIGLAVAFDDARFDAAGSVAIGVLLGVIAVVLAIEMKSLLIGEAADPKVVDSIRETVSSAAGVERLIHLRTQHLGPDEILVAMKVEFEGRLDMAGLAAAVDALETAVRAEVGTTCVIYVEPDLHRAGPQVS